MIKRIMYTRKGAVRNPNLEFCTKCKKKLELYEDIISRNGASSGVKHYCENCALELNLI